MKLNDVILSRILVDTEPHFSDFGAFYPISYDGFPFTIKTPVLEAPIGVVDFHGNKKFILNLRMNDNTVNSFKRIENKINKHKIIKITNNNLIKIKLVNPNCYNKHDYTKIYNIDNREIKSVHASKFIKPHDKIVCKFDIEGIFVSKNGHASLKMTAIYIKNMTKTDIDTTIQFIKIDQPDSVPPSSVNLSQSSSSD